MELYGDEIATQAFVEQEEDIYSLGRTHMLKVLSTRQTESVYVP